MPRQKQSDQSDIDASDNYTTYLEYNRVLRTWFVAFGIGGPALFLANDSVSKKLAAAGCLRTIAMGPFRTHRQQFHAVRA
jgi:hypothetical protein